MSTRLHGTLFSPAFWSCGRWCQWQHMESLTKLVFLQRAKNDKQKHKNDKSSHNFYIKYVLSFYQEIYTFVITWKAILKFRILRLLRGKEGLGLTFQVYALTPLFRIVFSELCPYTQHAFCAMHRVSLIQPPQRLYLSAVMPVPGYSGSGSKSGYLSTLLLSSSSVFRLTWALLDALTLGPFCFHLACFWDSDSMLTWFSAFTGLFHLFSASKIFLLSSLLWYFVPWDFCVKNYFYYHLNEFLEYRWYKCYFNLNYLPLFFTGGEFLIILLTITSYCIGCQGLCV